MVEIMRPEVVANEGVYSYPHICFDPVTVMPQLRCLRFGLEQERKNDARNGRRKTHHHVACLAQSLQALSLSNALTPPCRVCLHFTAFDVCTLPC